MSLTLKEAIQSQKLKLIAKELEALARQDRGVKKIVDQLKRGKEPNSSEINALKGDTQDEVVMAFASVIGPSKTSDFLGEEKKTIKVGEDAIGANKPHYVIVKDRKVIAKGDKKEMMEKCSEGERVWLSTKNVGDVVEEKGPCWDGYKQVGTKKGRKGNQVPNCVPEGNEDPEIGDREGSQPANYHKGLAKSTKEKRDAQFKKQAKMDDDNPAAYKPAPGDKRAKTKPSEYTKKFDKMFGEHVEELEEQNVEKALKNKSEKTGVAYGILKSVYDRGVAAWRTGHRPGTTPTQWGLARVNSFVTGGKTQKTADKDLWSKHKGKNEEVDLTEGIIDKMKNRIMIAFKRIAPDYYNVYQQSERLRKDLENDLVALERRYDAIMSIDKDPKYIAAMKKYDNYKQQQKQASDAGDYVAARKYSKLAKSAAPNFNEFLKKHMNEEFDLTEGAVSATKVKGELQKSGYHGVKMTNDRIEFKHKGKIHSIPVKSGFVSDSDYMAFQNKFEGYEMTEAVRVDTQRYVRSNKKEPSGRGRWLFTTKPMGTPKDDEVFSMSGIADYKQAMKKAQDWAKGKGSSAVYVMEAVDLEEGVYIEFKDQSAKEKWMKQNNIKSNDSDLVHLSKTDVVVKSRLEKYADANKFRNLISKTDTYKMRLSAFIDKYRKSMKKEEVELDEAVRVDKKKYSWGKMITVHDGKANSFPLHPEHQKKIKSLNDGQKVVFKDESGTAVTAQRKGDQIHLSNKMSSKKVPVDYSVFTESVELDEANMSVGDSVRVKDKPENVVDRQFFGKAGVISGKAGKDFMVKFPNGRSIVVDTKDLELVNEEVELEENFIRNLRQVAQRLGLRGIAWKLLDMERDQAAKRLKQSDIDGFVADAEKVLPLIKKGQQSYFKSLTNKLKQSGMKDPRLSISRMIEIGNYMSRIKEKSMNEAYDAPDYGHAGASDMALTQLHFIEYAAEEVRECLGAGAIMEEWYQNKLAKIHGEMEGLHSHMEGQKRRLEMCMGDMEVDSEEDIMSRYMYSEANHSPMHVNKAIRVAKDMGGNMTGAYDKIEKMSKGLSKHPKVQAALRLANEEVVSEKAESQAQAIAARIALKHKREGTQPEKGSASAEMIKMSEKDLEDFTKAKKGALEKVEESVIGEIEESLKLNVLGWGKRVNKVSSKDVNKMSVRTPLETLIHAWLEVADEVDEADYGSTQYDFADAELQWLSSLLNKKRVPTRELNKLLQKYQTTKKYPILKEAKMENSEVLSAAKKLASNGKDEKAKSFGKGLVDFYEKNKSFTPDQVAGLQNIMKNASFQMAETMDPVDKAALKKKFKDRKDKDINNDGKVDDSDEYLHKRRSTIAKAIAKEQSETTG